MVGLFDGETDGRFDGESVGLFDGKSDGLLGGESDDFPLAPPIIRFHLNYKTHP